MLQNRVNYRLSYQVVVEELERRQLRSASPVVVNGTSGNDTITITKSGGNDIATVNGTTVYSGPASSIDSITINAGDGSDTVTIGNNVDTGFPIITNLGAGADIFNGGTRNAADIVYGGDGNDTIHGGDGQDILLGEGGDDYIFGDTGGNVCVGGDGNDHIYGASDGRDILIGGTGADYEESEDLSDLLVGGNTSYDGNVTALQHFSALWRNANLSYVTRVSEIENGIPGTGEHLNSSTVFNDNAADNLRGGPDQDFYIVSAGDANGKESDETVLTV